MINNGMKTEFLEKLRHARGQHEKWVAEVLNNNTPQVEEDHTLCDFGKWILSVKEEMQDLPEFLDLEEPHRKLHMAYSTIMKTPGLGNIENEMKYYSTLLIERINLLEGVVRG